MTGRSAIETVRLRSGRAGSRVAPPAAVPYSQRRLDMKKLVLVLAAAGLFAGETGIRPRGSASDYPAQVTGAGATLGAAVLSPDQVKKLFAVDLNKLGYI